MTGHDPRVTMFGFYPLRHLGLEVEGGAMPSRTSDGRALLWGARGHLFAQVGLWRIVPFALAGGGVLGVASGNSVVGRDADAALHVGLGMKFYAHLRNGLGRDVRGTGHRVVRALVLTVVHLAAQVHGPRSGHAIDTALRSSGGGDGATNRVGVCMRAVRV